LIFGKLQYQVHYDEIHRELVSFIEQRFSNVESGQQSDSWIWITQGEDKVQIDTFTAMQHEVKSPNPDSLLVHDVLRALQSRFKVIVYPKPEFEAHEEHEE